MRARLLWLPLSLGVAGFGALAFLGCEEPSPPPMTLGITALEHDPYFPIDPNAAHALDRAVVGQGSMSCASCHPPGPTFETFQCLSCHAATPAAENQLDGAHASARGYAKSDANCLACHPRGIAEPQGAEGEGEGEGEPFNHDRDAFPVSDPAAAHNGIGCNECHADMASGDYSTTLCWGCHQNDSNPSIFEKHQPTAAQRLGEVFDADHSEASCRECHASTPAFPMSSHDSFMFPGHPLSPNCKDCHRSYKAEPKEWAIDFPSTTCTNTTGCHPSEPDCSAANREGC